MTRIEQIKKELEKISEQLEYTTTPLIIRNCERTRAILIAELMELENDRSSNQL